jgi:hypothetical protein
MGFVAACQLFPTTIACSSLVSPLRAGVSVNVQTIPDTLRWARIEAARLCKGSGQILEIPTASRFTGPQSSPASLLMLLMFLFVALLLLQAHQQVITADQLASVV